jgi:hypothetical protein
MTCYETTENPAKRKIGIRKRIMAVDDEPDINTTLQIGLEASGFDVDTFSIIINGKEMTAPIMAQEVGHTFGLEPQDSPHFDGGGHSKDQRNLTMMKVKPIRRRARRGSCQYKTRNNKSSFLNIQY